MKTKYGKHLEKELTKQIKAHQKELKYIATALKEMTDINEIYVNHLLEQFTYQQNKLDQLNTKLAQIQAIEGWL